MAKSNEKTFKVNVGTGSSSKFVEYPFKDSVFSTLVQVDVSAHVETKNGGFGKSLSYLSWTWAWDVVKRIYPDASYKVYHNPETYAPYVFDPNLGYMVFVSVTIRGETQEMWLPVMDSNNRAQKHVVYQQFKKDVQPATMFDINTTIMRCLVKCLAMFGLGSYIYAGESIPDDARTDALSANIEAQKKAAELQQKQNDRKKAAMKALSTCKTVDEVDMFLEEYKDLAGNEKFIAYVEQYKSNLSA